MRIAFKPADLEGVGCYRVIFPLRELKEQFDWEIEPFPMRERKLANGRTGRIFITKNLPLDAELIILQREMSLGTLDEIEAWQGEGRKVVLELDDDYARLPPSNPAWKSSHPDPHVRFDGEFDVRQEFAAFTVNRDNIWEIAQAVDAVTVTTPALAEQCARYNENVHVLPNTLDWEMWESVAPQYELNRERLRIGYMGVASWHEEDLRQLSGIIGPLLRTRPDVDFVAAGDPSLHDLLEIPEGQRISFDSVPFGEHVELTATMDVGLVPLVPGLFTEAKSALKGMEYNACGIPFVASPTGPYKSYVAASGGGLLAQRGHDWTRQISKLLDTPALRRELGRNGQRNVSRMTVQDNASRWRKAYEAITGSAIPISA